MGYRQFRREFGLLREGKVMVYVGGVLFLLLLIWLIWFVISQLRAKYSSSVHVIWYLFSLALCAAFVAFPWALDAGVIDTAGKPVKEAGKAFMSLLSFTLDLRADFWVLSALVFLIVGPQLLSYVLSGAFGCASRPRLVSYCVNFFAWGMAKSSAIAAGVLLASALFGGSHHWIGFDTKNSLKYAYFSLMLLSFSFIALLGSATVGEIPVLVHSRQLEPLRRWVRVCHKKAVKHRQGVNETLIELDR
jgi:hypothetical protein